MTYAGSKAQSGRGSSLSVGATPTLVGEIKSVSLNGGKWQTVDVTNLESLAAEFITTILDNGTVALKGNRVSSDAGQTAVEAAYASGALLSCVLALGKNASQTTTGDSYAFTALVVSRDFSVDITKEIDWSVELKVSGPITETAGS